MLGIPAPLKIRPSTQPSTLKRYIAPKALALLASFGRGFETAMIQETLSRNPLSVSWDRWLSARFQHQPPICSVSLAICSMIVANAWKCAWRNSMCRSAKDARSEEHTSELQSLMRISYAVFCLKKKINIYDSLYISSQPRMT